MKKLGGMANRLYGTAVWFRGAAGWLWRVVAGLLLLWLPAGCDVIEFHPYDTRFDGPTGLNAVHVARIEAACRGKKSVRFAVLSDTQRWYDETHEAVRSINARGDIDFVVHCGDLTDFGLTKEFVWMRDELQALRPPYVALLGNHDCLGTGADVFRRMYGSPDFAFTAGPVHFLCLNTNAYEYDYSVAVPDFAFIRADREALPEGVTRTVAAMHAAPLTEQFNNNVAPFFQAELHRFPGLSFCLCGHGHTTTQTDVFGDGILYYECGSAAKRRYLVFTIDEEGVEYEEVAY